MFGRCVLHCQMPSELGIRDGLCRGGIAAACVGAPDSLRLGASVWQADALCSAPDRWSGRLFLWRGPR